MQDYALGRELAGKELWLYVFQESRASFWVLLMGREGMMRVALGSGEGLRGGVHMQLPGFEGWADDAWVVLMRKMMRVASGSFLAACRCMSISSCLVFDQSSDFEWIEITKQSRPLCS